MSPRKPSSGLIAAILDGMSQRRSVKEILKLTGASTTVFYKVVADYPLWSRGYEPTETRKRSPRGRYRTKI